MRVSPRSSVFLSGSVLLATALIGTSPFGTSPVWAQDAAVAPVPQPARTTTAWSTFKGDAQRTGFSTANVKLPLSLTWRYTSDAPARTYISSPLVIGAPGRQRVVFGAGRNVFCLDVQTGAQVWRSINLSSSIVTPITLLSGDAGDLIIAGQQGGRVTALRGSDGGLAWEGDAQAAITDAGPVVINTPRGQRVVVAVSSGALVAFKLDGTIDTAWKVRLGRFGISPTSSMSLSPDGNLLYVCASDAKLYVIDTQKAELAYSLQMAANSSVTPIIADDRVITSNLQRVSAFEAKGGSAAWEFDPKGEIIGSPSLGKDATGKTVVFFGTREGNFYALDNAGALLWKTDVKAGITSPALVLPSLIVAGTNNGMLMGLDPATGAVTWQYRLKSERYSAPTQITGGFGGGRGGRGGAPAANAGQPATRLWGVSSAPSAIDGQMFVLGDNASLYSFSTQGLDAAAPRAIDPTLAVPDQANVITPLLITNNRSQSVPGRGPMYFAVQLEDTGSGVNPDSIKVTVDDVAIPATSIDWDMETGILTVTLLDPQKGTVSYSDGRKDLNVTAKDYMGNQLNLAISLDIDNTTPSPQPGGNNGGRGGNNGGRGGNNGGRGGGPFGGPDGGGPRGGGGDNGPGDNGPGDNGPGDDGPGDNGPGDNGPGDNGPDDGPGGRPGGGGGPGGGPGGTPQ